MSGNQKPGFFTKLKDNRTRILQISSILFALCYFLTYFSGASGNNAFMGLSAGVLALACLLPAVL